MESKGFPADKYSCVYPLTPIEGSKYTRLFTDCHQENKVQFTGSCPIMLRAKAHTDSAQFNETIQRQRDKAKPKWVFPTSLFPVVIFRDVTHILSEKERRNIALMRLRERKEVYVSINHSFIPRHWRREDFTTSNSCRPNVSEKTLLSLPTSQTYELLWLIE